MNQPAQPHASSSAQNASFPEAYFRKQLVSWSVETIFTELTRVQRQCLLLQEELYTRAALQNISMQQWQAFQSAVHSLLDFLRTFQEGEPVGDAFLQQRDAYINLLERYLDDPPPP